MTWQQEKAFRLSLWICECAGSQATKTFPHHERGVCHSWATTDAQSPSALANRSKGLHVPPSDQTLRGSSSGSTPPRGGHWAQSALLRRPSTERDTALPISWHEWVPTSDYALSGPVPPSSSTGPTPRRGTFNPNSLPAPSDLSSSPIAHPDSPLHVSPPGACPTSTRHGALAARVIQEGQQGPWRGTGASSRDTRKRAHGPKPRTPLPCRDRSRPGRGARGSLPTGSVITEGQEEPRHTSHPLGHRRTGQWVTRACGAELVT